MPSGNVEVLLEEIEGLRDGLSVIDTEIDDFVRSLRTAIRFDIAVLPHLDFLKALIDDLRELVKGNRKEEEVLKSMDKLSKTLSRKSKDKAIASFADIKDQLELEEEVKPIRSAINKKDYLGALVLISDMVERGNGTVMASINWEIQGLRELACELENPRLRNMVNQYVDGVEEQIEKGERKEAESLLKECKTRYQDVEAATRIVKTASWLDESVDALDPEVWSNIAKILHRYLLYVDVENHVMTRLRKAAKERKKIQKRIDEVSGDEILSDKVMVIIKDILENLGSDSRKKAKAYAISNYLLDLGIIKLDEDLQDLDNDLLIRLHENKDIMASWEKFWSNFWELYRTIGMSKRIGHISPEHMNRISELKASPGNLMAGNFDEIIGGIKSELQEVEENRERLDTLVKKINKIVSLFDSVDIEDSASKSITKFLEIKTNIDTGNSKKIAEGVQRLEGIHQELGQAYMVEQQTKRKEIEELTDYISDAKLSGADISGDLEGIVESREYQSIMEGHPVRLSVMDDIIRQLNEIKKDVTGAVERVKHAELKEEFDELLVWMDSLKKNYELSDIQEMVYSINEDEINRDVLVRARKAVEDYLSNLKPGLKVIISDEGSQDNKEPWVQLNVVNTGRIGLLDLSLKIEGENVEVGRLAPKMKEEVKVKGVTLKGNELTIVARYKLPEKEEPVEENLMASKETPGTKEEQEGVLRDELSISIGGNEAEDEGEMEELFDLGSDERPGEVHESSECTICRKSVEGERFFCPYCGKVYHYKCASETKWCPVCGNEFPEVSESEQGRDGEEPTQLFCPYCGSEIQKGDKKCGSCGKDLSKIL